MATKYKKEECEVEYEEDIILWEKERFPEETIWKIKSLEDYIDPASIRWWSRAIRLKEYNIWKSIHKKNLDTFSDGKIMKKLSEMYDN